MAERSRQFFMMTTDELRIKELKIKERLMQQKEKKCQAKIIIEEPRGKDLQCESKNKFLKIEAIEKLTESEDKNLSITNKSIL